MKKHASVSPSPVSKKFYASVTARVRESLTLIGRSDAVDETMAVIDRYMTAGTVPPTDCDSAVVLTFSLLRPEVDKAIRRSANARLRVANKALKSAKTTPATAARQSAPLVLATSTPSAVVSVPLDLVVSQASAAPSVVRSGFSAQPSADADDADGEPKKYVPRNRRERRLYEQEVRRATRRLVRRLASA